MKHQFTAWALKERFSGNIILGSEFSMKARGVLIIAKVLLFTDKEDAEKYIKSVYAFNHPFIIPVTITIEEDTT